MAKKRFYYLIDTLRVGNGSHMAPISPVQLALRESLFQTGYNLPCGEWALRTCYQTGRKVYLSVIFDGQRLVDSRLDHCSLLLMELWSITTGAPLPSLIYSDPVCTVEIF